MKSQEVDQFTVHDSCHQPAKAAGEALEERLSGNQPRLLCAAGGSSLHIFSQITDSACFGNLTVTVLDERVTTEATNRNFPALQQKKQIQKHNQDLTFIDPLADTKMSPKQAGDRFAKQLRDWKQVNPDGRVIATVGIGTDGHIAGMIPTEPDVFADRFQTDKLAVGYQDTSLDNQFTSRLTTTMQFFEDMLDTAVVYAVGDKKCSVLQDLLTSTQPLHDRPAEVLKDTNVDLFTDCKLEAYK